MSTILLVTRLIKYATMVKNLQRSPGLNMFETVTAYGNKLTGLMGQANAVSYNLDNSTQQFQRCMREAGHGRPRVT